MLKRYSIWLLAVVMAATALAGCGAQQEQTTAAAATAAAAPAEAAPAPEVDEDAIVYEAAANFFKTLPPHNNLIQLDDFKAKLDEGTQFFIVDIRAPEDYAAGHIEGAVNMPFAKVHASMDQLPKDKPIVVVCYSGHTASQTTAALKIAGFNARALIGGMKSWDGAQLPKVQS